ncbi:MerR family transcriptional regulator [Ovoidimarina sediminis]|uniref:MerR family transcriptional regulator n=1 Tax=Ovoidimarina sediminis TaxID=3079856 RepID=UPI00290620E9|nr:MerR family transcriptional regulator [Rhodophyticola sp. MJ-SS7]MDU8943582.1 MerR family transcriptional regulator [Rhodophyticola sp. MJ-SS7]
MSFDERTVVARIERLTLRELRLWVKQGWVRPAQGARGPVFDELDIARLRLLCDLRKDMAFPTDVMPTVLTLIDHLHRTRRELRRITEALDEQPAEVKRAVVAAVRRRAETGE